MWILIITLLHVGDPVTSGQFSPSVTGIDFLTKQSCENAKKVYLEQFSQAIKKLSRAIKDHNTTGEGDFSDNYLFQAICVVK